MMKHGLFCGLLLAICWPLFAQVSDASPDILLLLKDGETLSSLQTRWTNTKASNEDFVWAKSQIIGTRLPLFVLPTDQTHQERLYHWLQRQPEVRAVQWDGTVQFRKTPNDDQYFRQWDMEIISAPEAWEISTGGKTTNGTPIVVAVMDSGFYPNHEDLRDNLWHNNAEILGDNLDNDGNGYIDDDIGWDFRSDSPAIAPGDHGLSSAAIVGGAGDNGTGITGVNWDLELMLFSFTKISDLVQAYDYVIDQRKKFNESNGTAGAFVVATSNSFGQDRVQCDAQPVWAAMFDELGAAGILSSYGVGNTRYDVDISGDMPASCPSDYLVISCNTDEDDNLYTNSAFGEVSVDLGAPGEGTITARPANSYGGFGGNSAATPHVTGAIALLYSGECEGLEMDAIQQPAATAIRVKQLLMDGVDKIPSMMNRNQTDGRLNIARSMQMLATSCSNTLGELAITRLSPNPTKGPLRIEFLTPDNATYDLELFDALGRRCKHQKVEIGTSGLRQVDWEMSHLAAGVYWLRFGKEGEGVLRKIVVI